MGSRKILRKDNSYRSFKNERQDDDSGNEEEKKFSVMTSIEFIKMAKTLKLYPDYVPFAIVSQVIKENESNRFTIEQFA